MVGSTHWSAPSNEKPRTTTASLSTLRQMSGLWADEEAEPHSRSVDYALIISDSAGISAFSLSVIPANMQTFRIEGTKVPVGSSMVPARTYRQQRT